MLRDSPKATQELSGADVQIRAAWPRQNGSELDSQLFLATFNLKLTATKSAQPQNGGEELAVSLLVECWPGICEALCLMPMPSAELSRCVVVVQSCNPRPPDGEAGGSEVQGHSLIHCQFNASIRYMRPCLHKGKKKDAGKFRERQR